MDFDAVVVGAGPNGLAAAIELARNGWSVCLFEAAQTIGGGARSAELTLPGVSHDVCAAVFPLGAASPFFNELPLASYGVEWLAPPISLAHPFDDGTAALLHRSIERTCDALGGDGRAWARLFSPFVNHADQLLPEILAPLHLPRSPLITARFSVKALQSASGLADRHFSGVNARGLFAGIAGHSGMRLDRSPTAAFGLLLAIAGHRVGWPFVKGGAQKLTDALGAYFQSLGGQIVTGARISSLKELPAARAVICDVTPRQLTAIAGDELPRSYQRQLHRFRHGNGVFKVDWALRQPIPWKMADCRRAGTLHLGGSFEEIAAGEAIVVNGGHPEHPFVILAQQSVVDETRAPEGIHTVWAYCHVPNGSTVDMTDRIAAQIERFAPGFRDCIIAEHKTSTAQLESYNANYIGGDISGGLQNIGQIIARPAWRWIPCSTPLRNLYICSSSTPPGGGVHGMCGYHAARAVLKRFSV